MAGTLFGLGLSQQFDVNGDPLSGCLLYIYQANTSTPVTIYRDFALTLPHPWPLEADSAGRIPSFWLADGSYRARLTTEGGSEIFNEVNMAAIGASTGTGPGGDTTDPNSVSSTGDVKWRPTTGLLAGWVRMNGLTYGSLTSGADVIGADATHQPLYEYIWNNFSSPSSNVICPVVGGLGASAAADWATPKKITLLDMRNKSPFGLDDMGNSALGGFAGTTFTQGNATTGGSKGGVGTPITLAANQIPPLTITITDPQHDHATSPSTSFVQNGSGSFSPQVPGTSGNLAILDIIAASTGISAAYVNASQQSCQRMPPFMLGTWYWRL